jgi:hypothetical protein
MPTAYRCTLVEIGLPSPTGQREELNMKSDMKPVQVALKGKTVETPEKPMVRDELDDAALDQVSGGVLIGLRPVPIVTETVYISNPGSFHLGAWAL